MSVITSIIQAILQAIAWILPISESGHSAIFHDFAGRADGSVSALTGIIHIGIAIGIVVAMFKTFKTLSVQFATIGIDIAKKQFSLKRLKPSRQFLLMTLISFVPMLLWLIPIGENGFLFNVLRSSGYNKSLLDDGIFLALTGGMVFFASRQMSRSRNDNEVSVLNAVIVGILSIVLVPVSGLSLVGGIFSILIIMGVQKSLAFKYSMVISAPVLIVMGIIEICVSSVSAGVIQIILGIIFSVVSAFICVRLLKWVINKGYLMYISYYNLCLGLIIIIVGIVQLVVR